MADNVNKTPDICQKSWDKKCLDFGHITVHEHQLHNAAKTSLQGISFVGMSPENSESLICRSITGNKIQKTSTKVNMYFFAEQVCLSTFKFYFFCSHQGKIRCLNNLTTSIKFLSDAE